MLLTFVGSWLPGLGILASFRTSWLRVFNLYFAACLSLERLLVLRTRLSCHGVPSL